MGAVETLIYNAGGAVWGSVEEVSAADFEMGWRINALGAFLAAQKVMVMMARRLRFLSFWKRRASSRYPESSLNLTGSWMSALGRPTSTGVE